ncbi:hypothetical protein MJ1HA_1284 [Metallosphaera sedula]|nr:hypothetical protein MJ1HA_1284 [Metallosphaera sedula]
MEGLESINKIPETLTWLGLPLPRERGETRNRELRLLTIP